MTARTRGGDRRGDEACELDHPRPGDVRHGDEDRSEDQRGTEVRLHEDQERGDREYAEGFEEDGVFADGPLGEIPGQNYDHAQLGELGRLHLHGSYVHPPLGAAGRSSKQQHGEEHEDNEAVDGPEVALPEPVVYERQWNGPYHPEDETKRLVGGVGLLVDRAGHVDGEDAEGGERQGDQE